MIAIKMLLPVCLGIAAVAIFVAPATSRDEPRGTVDDRARQFIAEHEKKLRPLEVASALAWWNANISGKDEDFAKKEAAQNKIDEALADRDTFKNLEGLYRSTGLSDPQLRRMIHLLYLQYVEKQVDPALLKKVVAK